MNYFLIGTLGFVFSLSARAEIPTHESLTNLLEEVRDPHFTSTQRKEVLEFSREKMLFHLSHELGVSPEKVTHSVLENPFRLQMFHQDPWYDLQTEFYTTLHQQNFIDRWNSLLGLVKFSEYGESIFNTMNAHLGDYSPVNEGRFYVRWSKTGKYKKVPYFLQSTDIQKLIDVEAHVPYEELIPENELNEFLLKADKLSRLKKQELAEKSELIKRIYHRALINSAKTIGTLYFLTGVLNLNETEKQINDYINNFCFKCSNKKKEDAKTSVMSYLLASKKETSDYNLESIATGFCSDLRVNNYYWNINKLNPTPFEILANKTELIDYYTIYNLKKKNQQALAKTILSHEFGNLFLTKTLNILNKKGEPLGTYLKCLSSSLKEDTKLIRDAIEEARINTETYILEINKKLSTAAYSLKESDQILEYFVQTNQKATIESVVSFPQGIGWILKSIALLEQDLGRRKKVDTIVTWGGFIVGVGLTVTGIGAPEGVAVLVTTAGIINGLSSGSYFLVRSKQEKRFYKDILLAKVGGAQSNEQILAEHYKKYKLLKVAYIKEFAGTAFLFARLHKLALKKSGGDIVKVHKVMDKVMVTAKESTKDVSLNFLEDAIIEKILN